MRLLFVFLVLIFVLLALNSAQSLLVNASNNKTPPYANKVDKMMVCNLIQDSHVSEAIKALDMKLEKLIALVNKTSFPVPQPTTPPGMHSDKNKCLLFLYNTVIFALTSVQPSSYFLQPLPSPHARNSMTKTSKAI